jgi:hypothetical protein
MRQVASYIAAVYQISKNALDFVQVNGHPKPLERICDMIERDLVGLQYNMNPFEKVAVAHCLALFQ